MSSIAMIVAIVCYLSLLSANRCVVADDYNDNARPYEFSFNIVDFQHRFEKKDADGIVTGEYGFITADGVYHETAYATDKDGDFKITRMRNRKITSLSDAEELFEDKPEVAKMLVESLVRTCSSCKIPNAKNEIEGASESFVEVEKRRKNDKISGEIPDVEKDLISTSESLDQSRNALSRRIPGSPKNLESTVKLQESSGRIDDEEGINRKPNKIPRSSNEISTNEENRTSSRDESPEAPRKMLKEMTAAGDKTPSEKETENSRGGKALTIDDTLLGKTNDLYYRFNYTITSHDHQEEGYRNGDKSGGYRTKNDDNIDTKVKYLSNEFGHQPNITFVARPTAEEEEGDGLKGYSFVWYRQ